ncbi:MAG: DUF3316 domain-containing protein [Bacteroides sp.]|nr:DUF3316 domain-containing protein [Bacteroides sp.]
MRNKVTCLLLLIGTFAYTVTAQTDPAVVEVRTDTIIRVQTDTVTAYVRPAMGRSPGYPVQTRYVNRAVMYGVGAANVFDTYLSPQEYTGVELRISRETMRMTRLFDGNVSLQNYLQAHLSYTHNHVDNNNTFAGLINWNYGLHYQLRITDNFKLLAGGLADMNLGFAYNLRNGNNPANAKAYINLAASGMAIWKLRIRNYPMTLRYQANLPFMGVMFSPNYGQSYYEIFTLGEYSGVVRFTSLHNQPAIRQMVSADIPVAGIKMRFSYLWDVQQAHVNKIKSHTYSHVFMVGFVRDLYRIPPRSDPYIFLGSSTVY